MWDLPGPGLEPMFPALAGGFLTTVPPGKSLLFLYLLLICNILLSAIIVSVRTVNMMLH